MRRTLVLLALAGCQPELSFPAGYAKTYVEVRSCRPSSEHDSHNIRVLASPSAAGPYLSRDGGFPLGAVVLKEERDYGDLDCSGPVLLWTVMTLVPDAGSSSWRWQSVSADRDVLSTDEPRCLGCHATCGQPPDGYQGTCAIP